ncbi:MAG: LysR family transcriptional regulator [Sphingomonadales bacterium]|nr:LysR family transcriptional regulator [Sphingomonadales bacterium]
MKISLRQLEVFDAVAACGSVTGAASVLNMSQSAASKALTDLQIVLGRKLFAHAKGRALQITDEGKRLRPVVRSLLAEVQDVVRPEAPTALTGTLVIGATSSIAETVVSRLCAEFMQLHPGVKVRVDASGVGELFDRLARFDLETALIEYFPDMDGIELVPWRHDEMLLVALPDHPLAGRTGIALTELAGARWCMRESYSSIASRLRYLLQGPVGQLDVAFESTSNAAVRQAVLAGIGIGCMSQALVRHDLETGRLVHLDVPDFHYSRVLSLARPKHIWRSRLVSAFDDFVLARGDAASGPDPSNESMTVISR